MEEIAINDCVVHRLNPEKKMIVVSYQKTTLPNIQGVGDRGVILGEDIERIDENTLLCSWEDGQGSPQSAYYRRDVLVKCPG